MSSNKNILYHYTDFAALHGILSNSELRLNNILNMNDASEMSLFMNGLCKSVADRLRAGGDGERADWIEKIFSEEREQEFVYSAYAACFSRYRDDAAQWERYANRGRGVCIAFREELLRKMVAEPLSLQTVFYQDTVGEHALAETLYHLVQHCGRPFRMTPEIRETLNHAWAASAAFKHPSFASENEVRLVVSPFEHGYFDVQPCYHITNERIKKYYPVNLEELCAAVGICLDDVIVELTIGPESTQSIPILQDYLKDLGHRRMAESVVRSACPLRQKI